jgi:hypothetical protein
MYLYQLLQLYEIVHAFLQILCLEEIEKARKIVKVFHNHNTLFTFTHLYLLNFVNKLINYLALLPFEYYRRSNKMLFNVIILRLMQYYLFIFIYFFFKNF